MFGGITGSNISKSVSRDLWEFDFERYTWCEIVPTVGLVPPERHNHAAAAINGEKWMMIYGGCHNSSRTQYLHDCWIFDTTSTMWHELALFGVPQPLRSDSASAWIGDGYLVIYGQSPFIVQFSLVDVVIHRIIVILIIVHIYGSLQVG